MAQEALKFADDVFVFETVMRVRSTEITIGRQVSIEAMTSMLSEATARFFYAQGIKEINAVYHGLLVTDSCCQFLSRAKAREELLFEVGATNLTEKSGDIAIKVTRMHDASMVVLAKFGFVNFDYRSNKVVALDDTVKEALTPNVNSFVI